jgi:hypothetical protein
VRTPLGVIHPRTVRGLWRLRDLDRPAVVATLRGIFGEVEGFVEVFGDEATGPTSRRVRREVVLTWRGERAKTEWTVYLRGQGVRHVGVIVDDVAPKQPPEGYRAELRTLVEPLMSLAAASGARFFVAGADATSGPLDRVLDAIV